jgi:DNA-binding MarR family transcriptional regulator
MTRAPLQCGVLGALENPLPQDQASLGGLLALDRSTLAAVVRNLEGRGLVIWPTSLAHLSGPPSPPLAAP